MLDRPDRLQLVSLTDQVIIGLARLAASWVKSADIGIEWLEPGNLPALAELQSLMARQNDRLVAALARTVLETILATLDSDEFDRDGSEGPDELAAMTRGVFSSAAATLFLAAVAAGSNPLSGEVAGHLAEFQLSAAGNCTYDNPTADMAAVIRK